MQKGDIQAFCAFARGFVYQLHSLSSDLVERVLHSVGSECQVMNPFAAFLDKFGDRTLWIGRFQQLEFSLPDHEECCFNLLVDDFFDAVTF